MKRETAADIDRIAADWVVREDRRPLTSDECAERDAWMKADPRREGAYVRAHAAWAMMDRGRALAAPGQARRWPLATRREMLAAGLALTFGLGGVLTVSRLGQDRYRTSRGEIRRVPLRDGSSVAINTGSRLEVEMEPERRTVRLARGEAWFDVAKDRARPFVVEAGDVRVRAVGTAFSVRRIEGGGAEVIVTEGVVEAWSGDAAAPVRIAAGSRAMVAETKAAPVAQPLPAATVERLLAWREGMVGLDGETLEQAAAEFNRYNERQIVIDDPVLAQERLVGYFRATDPESFVRAVTKTLNAQADVDGRRLRIVSAAS